MCAVEKTKLELEEKAFFEEAGRVIVVVAGIALICYFVRMWL